MVLQEEAERMAAKLEELKKHLQKEKEKRDGVRNEGIFLGEVSETRSSTSVEDRSTGEIFKFLAYCALEKYFEKFVENGITSIKELKNSSESCLETLGIPIGHRIKIAKYLKTFKENPEKQEEILMVTSEVSSGNSSYPTVLKVSCWGCYKVLAEILVYTSAFNYHFCSEKCFESFKKSEFATCKCLKEFYKKTGVSSNRVWFCSAQCLNS